VLFLSADGAFHLLSAVETLGGTRVSSLSDRLRIGKWLRENVNLARLNQAVSAWDSQMKVAYFFLPRAGSTTNDLTLKFDFSKTDEGGLPEFTYSYRDNVDAATIRRDSDQIGRPIVGEGGFVWKLEQSARSKAGAGYTGKYQTPHLDFSFADEKLVGVEKLYDALELFQEPTGDGALTVEVYVDTVLRQTLTFSTNVRYQRKALHCGKGRTLSLRVYNLDADVDFKVCGHVVWLRPSAEEDGR
jgi:hypothetical protein